MTSCDMKVPGTIVSRIILKAVTMIIRLLSILFILLFSQGIKAQGLEPRYHLQPRRPAPLKTSEGHQHHQWQEGGSEISGQPDRPRIYPRPHPQNPC